MEQNKENNFLAENIKINSFQDCDTVSIIIPIHNRTHTLGYTLESVLDQYGLGFKLEFVLVDDASEDHPYETIIKPFMDKIMLSPILAKTLKFTYTKVNFKSAAKSRDKGLELCTGDYIMFLDSDDEFYSKNSVKMLYNRCKELTTSGIPTLVYGDTYLFIQNSYNDWIVSHKFIFPKFDKDFFYKSEGMIPTGSFMFPKEIKEKASPFYADLTVGEDFVWQMDLVNEGFAFEHIDYPILCYYRKKEGVFSSLDARTREEDLDEIQKIAIGYRDNLEVEFKPEGLKPEDLKPTPKGPIYNIDKTKYPIFARLERDTYLSVPRTLEIDVYLDGKIQGDVSNRSNILWILDEVYDHNIINEELLQYDFLLVGNADLEYRLKKRLTKEYTQFVPFPYSTRLFPLRSKMPIEPKVGIIGKNPAIELTLDQTKIPYVNLDLSDFFTSKINEVSVCINTSNLYFNPLYSYLCYTNNILLFDTAQRGRQGVACSYGSNVEIISPDLIDVIKRVLIDISVEHRVKQLEDFHKLNPINDNIYSLKIFEDNISSIFGD